MATIASPRCFATTVPQGVICDYQFHGSSAIRNIETATISRILVAHGSYINSLTVHYRGEDSGTKYGQPGGDVKEVILEPKEFIITIEGYARAGGSGMSQLTFVSNTGKRWGPYGDIAGLDKFSWHGRDLVEKDVTSQMGLLYLSGSYGTSCISRLQATFSTYSAPVHPPRVVIYEQEAHLDSSAPAGLSKFAQTLMSPVITLNVGPDGIIFRAYEDTLCRLPFFRAALKGEFLEASENQVKMPEDKPEVVSALIQFLYNGNYTYTYKAPAPGSSAKDENTPAVELREGLFHARVYALASKYDCQALADAAKQSLTYVLKELKGIDVVRLLKEAYDQGWGASEWEKEEDMLEFMHGLPKLLKELFVSNRDDMELLATECSALGWELLRLVVSS